MAEAFTIDTDILGFILETTLDDLGDEDLVRNCWRWITEYTPVPNHFKKCVQSAVAVLTGIMEDPLS